MEEQTQSRPSLDPSVKRGNILSVIFILLAFGVIAGLAVNLVMRGNGVSCPDELIGQWNTAARGYEERSLVITRNSVTFSAGTDHFDAEAVRRIEATPDGPRTLYHLVYGNSRNEEQTLLFYYHPREQTITFKNQSHLVWTRKTVES